MNDITKPQGVKENAINDTVATPAAPVAVPPGTLSASTPPATPDSNPKEKEKKQSKLRSILSTIAVLLIAPILALTITAYVFQSYEVDGPSMQSTLQDHDRLIIWKVSRTWARITHHDYTPERGDVIVFIKKGLYEGNSSKEKQLIKRVIAFAGERVTVKDGKVLVYNTEHPNGFSPDATLPYGNVITNTDGNLDLTVPAGQVFVCGDNRQNSLDSRYFGPVPLNDIVGKLAVRILPISNAKKF
jgi:signal peptidase I